LGSSRMPKEFEECVRKGGRIITKTIGKDKYIHICYLNGKSYAGEVKKKKLESSRK